MFFDDLILPLRKAAALRAPPVPETGWIAPSYYPNLSNALVISFDTETFDPELNEHGPGWSRGPVGYICGASVAAIMPNGERWTGYFPVRHTADTGANLDPKHTFAWLKATLETRHIPKVGANLLYDIGWLLEEGIQVEGTLYDVQIAEALLNESGEVNLDYLGAKYLGRGKETSELYQWCAQAFGGSASQTQRKNIYRCPPKLVGKYAEADADIPLDVLTRQTPLLHNESLWKLFELECSLIRLLVKMRWKGVRIDVGRAEQLDGELGVIQAEIQAELNRLVGFELNVNEADSIARAFDAEGIKYNRTAATAAKPNGSPSFRKDFLTNLDHPIATGINGVREHAKLRGTFLQGYLLNGNTNGYVHCSFNQLRADDGGTRTGRFSSSDPNLQNIPIRSKAGAKIRTAFVPHCGHRRWHKKDFSQIEYRFHVHYAVGDGIEVVREQYRNDPKTDFHVFTQELIKRIANMIVDRKPVKNINFGLLYGMGEAKLARSLGLSPEEADALFEAYHLATPYTKATMEAVMQEAQQLGYITTILGRRRRFDLWKPRGFGNDLPLPYDIAIKQYGSNIERAHTHKGINSRYQGSSADQMKAAMAALEQSGVFDYVGVPLLTVHDELDFSEPDGSKATQEAFDFITHTMENVIPLRIPVKAESSYGETWGAAA